MDIKSLAPAALPRVVSIESHTIEAVAVALCATYAACTGHLSSSELLMAYGGALGSPVVNRLLGTKVRGPVTSVVAMGLASVAAVRHLGVTVLLGLLLTGCVGVQLPDPVDVNRVMVGVSAACKPEPEPKWCIETIPALNRIADVLEAVPQ